MKNFLNESDSIFYSEKKNMIGIRQLCPSIKHSCCSYIELQSLFDKVDQGLNNYLKSNIS